MVCPDTYPSRIVIYPVDSAIQRLNNRGQCIEEMNLNFLLGSFHYANRHPNNNDLEIFHHSLRHPTASPPQSTNFSQMIVCFSQ